MFCTRYLATVALAGSLALTACSEESSGPSTRAVVGVAALATSSSSIRLTFNSRAGDDSYTIERAEGALGAFESAGSVDAPNVAGQVTFNDADLTITTMYRYRVITVRGAETSDPSAEVSTTTLGLQNAAADITVDIPTNRTLYADTVYTLKGFIHVVNGATLTIQPGTKIVGDFDIVGSSLMILRGARIEAVGTAQLPIVFTSARAPGARQPGDWGGLVIVGNAPINRTGLTIAVEGSGTNVNNNYNAIFSGGDTPTDNSGTLAYVRVEFGGYAPVVNAELNSFTFAAVGSGTQASYLQSIAGLDDAFEWFGGSADYHHLVAYETGDDMFDMSTGFTGRLQYAIGINTTLLTPRTSAGAAATDPQGIENDNCPSAEAGCTSGHNTTPLTIPVVANFTLIGTNDVATSGSSGGVGVLLRRGVGGYYVNGVVGRFPRFGASLRDAETYTRAGSTTIPDLTTADLAMRNIVFTDVPVVFQTAQAGVFDLPGNAITNPATATAALFTALPAAGAVPAGVASFDWTPAGGSAIASGGLSTFTGKLLAAAGAFVVPTTYMGAADPAGAKWWADWTVYFRN